MPEPPIRPTLRPVPAKPSAVRPSPEDAYRKSVEDVIEAMKGETTMRTRAELREDAKRAVYRFFAEKGSEK